MRGHYSIQRGMVLVTSLVILMILTMLGLSSVQGTSIQELISRNQRDGNLAFNAAETAIVDAEATLAGLSATGWKAIVDGNFSIGGSPRVYNAMLLGSFFENTAEPASSGFGNNVQVSLSDVSVQPIFFIEYLGMVTTDEDRLNIDNIGQNPTTNIQMFRITAQGRGGTRAAVAIVQSNYGRRF
jgi:type IV pilus assembly protein PilX